nr:hypothetical protein [Tanacetum cinerariifolium]
MKLKPLLDLQGRKLDHGRVYGNWDGNQRYNQGGRMQEGPYESDKPKNTRNIIIAVHNQVCWHRHKQLGNWKHDNANGYKYGRWH